MVRAAEAELGDGAPVARTISVQFLEAPSHGPVEVGVEILRRGKRVAVCDVRMREADRLVAQMTLVCSAPRPHEGRLTGSPPQAPRFEAVEEVDIGRAPGAPRLFGEVEIRPTVGPAIFSDAADAVTGGWLALRDDAVLARLETGNLQEGHIEEHGQLWSSEGTLLAESHQLALLIPLPRQR